MHLRKNVEKVGGRVQKVRRRPHPCCVALIRPMRDLHKLELHTPRDKLSRRVCRAPHACPEATVRGALLTSLSSHHPHTPSYTYFTHTTLHIPTPSLPSLLLLPLDLCYLLSISFDGSTNLKLENGSPAQTRGF